MFDVSSLSREEIANMAMDDAHLFQIRLHDPVAKTDCVVDYYFDGDRLLSFGDKIKITGIHTKQMRDHAQALLDKGDYKFDFEGTRA